MGGGPERSFGAFRSEGLVKIVFVCFLDLTLNLALALALQGKATFK